MKKLGFFAVLCALAISTSVWACPEGKLHDEKKDGKSVPTAPATPSTGTQAPATGGK